MVIDSAEQPKCFWPDTLCFRLTCQDEREVGALDFLYPQSCSQLGKCAFAARWAEDGNFGSSVNLLPSADSDTPQPE